LTGSSEELGHRVSVVGDGEPEPSSARVVEQPVLHGRSGQPVLRGVLAHVLLETISTVLELATDVLGEVRLVVAPGEVLRRGPWFGAEDQRDLEVTGGDRPGELRHQLLRTVAPDGLEHRTRRIGADPVGHRSHVVVGAAERRLCERGADLELTQAGKHLDSLGHRVHVRAGVSECGPHRLGRQID